MQSKSVFGPRARLAIRFYVGVGWVVLGLLSMFLGPYSAYPATDQRSSPLFWIEIGLVVVVLGALLVGYALRDLRQLRRDTHRTR